MKPIANYIGFGLFVAGLIFASWYAAYVPVSDASEPALVGSERIAAWAEVAGLPFGIGWAAMIVGVVIARVATRRRATDDGRGSSAAAAIEQLGLIAKRIDDLVAAYPEVATLRGRERTAADEIDAILEDEVPVFLESRLELIDKLGLETFAELIGHFATMERSTARAWSALIDEAYEEVIPSLKRAQAAVHRALEIGSSSFAG